jgi:phosphotransferase system  glucose/maltose/N-acetylglucosamine-specific IIC component
VVTRLVVHGTFSGPLLGLASAGLLATPTGVASSRFADGYLAELWLQADLPRLLVPLGLAHALVMARVQRTGGAAGEPADGTRGTCVKRRAERRPALLGEWTPTGGDERRSRRTPS